MVVLKLWRPVCGTNSNVHVAGPVTSGCPARENVRGPFHVPDKKEVSPGELGVEPPPHLASTTDANPIIESASPRCVVRNAITSLPTPQYTGSMLVTAS